MHSFLLATNVFPDASTNDYHDFRKLDQLLDSTHDDVEQRSIIKQIQDESSSYAIQGGGTVRWVIDEHSNKISEFHSNYKYSSVKAAGKL